MDIESAVTRFVEDDVLGGRQVGPEDSLFKEGRVDSLAIMKVILFVEETFGLTIDLEEMVPEHFDSVRAIVAFVQRKTVAVQVGPRNDDRDRRSRRTNNGISRPTI